MNKAKNHWPAGVKRTKQRESVMRVLERAAKPLSAAELYSLIAKRGDSVWLSTVYRILEIFVKKGAAVKTNVMGSDMAVYELNRFKHKHYAVCVGCNRMIALEHCPLETFVPKLADADFHVTGHNLEVYGFCGDCGAEE